jgi:serine/threonine protein kinase
VSSADETVSPDAARATILPEALQASFGKELRNAFVVNPAAAGAFNIPGYELSDKLGKGGMGVVYRALQKSTGRTVALKLLSVSSLGTDAEAARFRNEIETAASLIHPDIATVYEGGVAGNVIYYAMELVDGHRLDEHLQQRNLDRPARIALIIRVARAVQFAHERLIMHRDLKPANIMVTASGQPKIVDFGLAKTIGSDTHHTLTDQIAGTPAFMSPEQAAGQRFLTTATDVYSLGVIAYKMVIGKDPIDVSGPFAEVLDRVRFAEPVPPRRADPSVHPDLEAVLSKSLAKRAADRYPTAGEFADDLQAYLDSAPVTARRRTPIYIAQRWIRRHRTPVAIATAVAVTLLALAASNLVVITQSRFQSLQAAMENDNERDRTRTSRGVSVENRAASIGLCNDLLAALAPATNREPEPIDSDMLDAVSRSLLNLVDVGQQGNQLQLVEEGLASALAKAADLQVAAGNYRGARELYDALLSMRPDPAHALARAWCDYLAGDRATNPSADSVVAPTDAAPTATIVRALVRPAADGQSIASLRQQILTSNRTSYVDASIQSEALRRLTLFDLEQGGTIESIDTTLELLRARDRRLLGLLSHDDAYQSILASHQRILSLLPAHSAQIGTHRAWLESLRRPRK